MRVQPKKSLGQHFLADANCCKKIVRYAEIEPSDMVVEIGSGTGQLTRHLVDAARQVVAIEFDSNLIERLKERFRDQARLELVAGDVLKLNWADMVRGGPVKIVGNLPYHIATQVLLKMISIKDRFQSLTCMVQKELAERILAKPGNKNYGYFTVLMEYHFLRIKGWDVPPEVFVPRPKVMSHVMKLAPRDPPCMVPNYQHFVALLKQSFRHRRKTLRNNLKGQGRDLRAAEVFQACRIDPRARPEQVTLEQYCCLARML